VTALGTRRDFRAGFFRIESIATNAVEGDLSALPIIKFPVAAIIINPKRTKHSEDQEAIKKHVEGKIGRGNHGDTPK